MIVSRSRAFLAAVVLALATQASPVLAQSTGPKILRPGAQTAPADRPRQGDGIQVDRLDAPGRVAAGLLTEDNGGLPANLWSGSDRDVVATLFQRMPDHYRSAAARELARQLLLSAGDIAPGRLDDNALLAIRMTRLLHLGDAQSAVALAEAAGGGATAPEVAEPLTEALFVLGETERACDTAQGQIRLGGRGYWQKATVFCDLLAGRDSDADLTRSLLSETGQKDPLFDTLADALQSDRPATIDATPDMQAIHVAMLIAAKSATLRKRDQLPPHLAVQVAAAPRMDTDDRIAAGTIAIRDAGMSPAIIMLLFDGKTGPAGQPFRDPVVVAMGATSDAVRAEALNDLWNKSAKVEDRHVAAAYAEGFLSKLQAESGVTFMAPAALRMSLLNGDRSRARDWMAALRRNAAAGEGEAVAEQTRAQPLVQVAGLTSVDDRTLDLWLAGKTGSAADRQHALTVLMLLDALGTPAGSRIWQSALGTAADGSAPSDPGLWRQLVMATGGGRLGEAVQAALALIGADGPAGLDPVAISTIVGSLRRLGLEDAARRLAVETVIAQGG
ncbi:hypothetical protein [Minwuia sp.]|uniref:hypothetical protein n=1 Tax=Minwuia sp. TaxID=2493630 RepID=UPI003A91629D